MEPRFAHLCETGEARQTWLRGLEKINNLYPIVAVARKMGFHMLNALGIGKPRHLNGRIRALLARSEALFAFTDGEKRTFNDIPTGS